MKNDIRKVAACGVGTALYVAFSMVLKIPIAGHASLDLGYVVFAAWCYFYGPVAGAAVGGLGCALVGLLSSGQLAPGWIPGNVLAGLLAGQAGKRREMPAAARAGLMFLAVFTCVFACKCAVECPMYGIPFAAKAPRTLIVAATDGLCMAAGALLAPRLPSGVRVGFEAGPVSGASGGTVAKREFRYAVAGPDGNEVAAVAFDRKLNKVEEAALWNCKDAASGLAPGGREAAQAVLDRFYEHGGPRGRWAGEPAMR